MVGAEENSDKLSRALPSRFNRLVPQLKASDFDYIIFDMPAVNQISITPRLAQFMDMVLLVFDSEHTDRDIAKQATMLLAESRAHVGADSEQNPQLCAIAGSPRIPWQRLIRTTPFLRATVSVIFLAVSAIDAAMQG